jgi:hypothetical protein
MVDDRIKSKLIGVINSINNGKSISFRVKCASSLLSLPFMAAAASYLFPNTSFLPVLRIFDSKV